MVKKICFDFDGVLVDSFEQGVSQTQIMARYLGYPVPTKDEIGQAWGLVWQEYARKLLPGIQPQDYLDAYRSCGLEDQVAPAVAGAQSTIGRLKKEYKLSLISNREGTSLRKLFASAGFKSRDFMYIQTASDTCFHKPDSRVFEKVLSLAKDNKIQEEEILYVGDTLVDYEATKKTKIQFCAVLSGTGTQDDFLGAGLSQQRILPSVSALDKVLA